MTDIGIGQAVFLGILQGITEFLPVSSSGHLVIAQKLFGVTEPELLFDTFLHTGTLAAVCVALRHDIGALLKNPFQKLSGLLLLATAVTTVFAFAFKKITVASGVSILEAALGSAAFVGAAFLCTALILAAAEWLFRRGGMVRRGTEMNWKDAFWIGAAQGIGILPGISRSGATLAGALGRHLEREFAARFSFLLSIPAVLGALLLQLKELSGHTAAAVNWPAIAAGTACAAAAGFFSVSFMIKLIKRKPLYGFSLWTAALGLSVLLDVFVTRRFF